MNPRVKAVTPHPDYTLTLVFANDEVKTFDVKPYLDKGIFRELRDLAVFNSVKPFLGSIQWQNGQDLCPDTLYLDSVPVSDQDNTANGDQAGLHTARAEVTDTEAEMPEES